MTNTLVCAGAVIAFAASPYSEAHISAFEAVNDFIPIASLH